jgi:preprotein translocase SecF subunit
VVTQPKLRQSRAPNRDVSSCILGSNEKTFTGTGTVEEWTLQTMEFYFQNRTDGFITKTWSAFLKGIHLLLLGIVNSILAAVFLFGVLIAFFVVAKSKYRGNFGLASRGLQAVVHLSVHLAAMWGLYSLLAYANYTATAMVTMPLRLLPTFPVPEGKYLKIRGAAAVSGKVSNELFQGGIIACLLALAAIALYIWFRFESKFGWAALITTFHDVYAILGLFSIFKAYLVFDLTIVAGVLTLAGYSINDKVVVFDRIREMLKKYKKIPLPKIIDISITATLSRTLITSLATMMAGGAMLFLGGPVLFGFAVSICFGIIIGTYSSIFVAAPLLIHLPGRVPGQRVEKGEEATAGAT